ncbi:Uncharacterized protein FKW44_001782 [Caligus rogercresseyi]|uniref:Uncharacterized protein n=1 Tax=Caligus rogercresseyi TaxID=217165 RepID=A0A7T8QVU8_CALRO|nr:Uncharacterized protein FKW44_001782 [Caligus rogercresseyi]
MKLRSRLAQASSMADFRCSFEVKLIPERELFSRPKAAKSNTDRLGLYGGQ